MTSSSIPSQEGRVAVLSFGKRCARASRFLGVFGVVLLVALASRSQAITWGTIDTTHLEGLAAAGAIQDASFINVGYGDNQEFVVTGDRQISVSSFRNLHDAWLYLSQNIHHGDGGTCYRDSGGPTFFVDPSSHAEYIVATTSWGDGPCKATNNNYRLDIASSLDFIEAMIGQNP